MTKMSVNKVPFDLQVEIIKKVLPVKSLLRFRSVSKQWKSLIDSSQFIIDHSVSQTRPRRMLLSYQYEEFVSISDDDSFPHNMSFPFRPPPTVKSSPHAFLFDCSHGLVCSYFVHDRDIVDGKDVVVLWNPSIRKSVEIVLPHGSIIGVGVGLCPTTSDPKIVMVSADQKAEVFTLSTRAWKSIPMNLCRPLKSFDFNHYQVVIDGVIHWIAYELGGTNAVIFSFDLTSEEFGELALHSSLQTGLRFIYKLNESLALVDWSDGLDLCDVWMMKKNSVRESPFTKLYTINFGRMDNFIIAFRMNGQPIVSEVDISDDGDMTRKFKVYEPHSKNIKYLEIDTSYGLWFGTATCYTESLLLLDHFTNNS